MSEEEILKQAIANVELEGYTVPDELKELLSKVASGEMSAQEAIAESLYKYKVSNTVELAFEDRLIEMENNHE